MDCQTCLNQLLRRICALFRDKLEKKGLVAIARGRAHPKLTSRELSRGEYGSVQKPPS
jgi:hypothetical protein